MDADLETRVEQAWENTKAWVTEFEGAPSLALLLGVPEESVLPGLSALSQQTENFRITATSVEHKDVPHFIPLDSFPLQLAQLKEGQLWELSVNYAVRREVFDLDIHIVLYYLEQGKLALEVYWWSDQVFSSETDDRAQFSALLGYFLELQKLVNADYLYLRPEHGGEEDWVEV